MPARFEKPKDHPHVAVVTINRPERANSLDPETLRDLAAHWARINQDADVRVAVLTGAGDRIFCAGMDMGGGGGPGQYCDRLGTLQPLNSGVCANHEKNVNIS